MTHDTKRASYRAALPLAAMAALLLAGCSTGHIGESWQCPLAEGGTCDSVAAADPAVPDPKAAGTTVLAEPLWRMRGDGRPETTPDAIRGPAQAAETPCAADCSAGFDPIAWLARLFGSGESGGADDRAGSDEAMAAEAGSATETPAPSGHADRETDTPASPPAATREETRAADPDTALLPAEPGPAQDGPDGGDLRTGEVVARIWIAPFVDADGVYREASWVRALLAPAGWRLP